MDAAGKGQRTFSGGVGWFVYCVAIRPRCANAAGYILYPFSAIKIKVIIMTMNLKESIERLKEAREKCVNTVDKSTLEKIDKALEDLELIHKEKEPKKINWLSIAVKVLYLIKLATVGDIDEG